MKNRPEVTAIDFFYIEEFFSISAHRVSGGMGINPLAQADILARAELIGYISAEDKLWYLSVMKELDSVFIDYAHKKQKLAEVPSAPGVRHVNR